VYNSLAFEKIVLRMQEENCMQTPESVRNLGKPVLCRGISIVILLCCAVTSRAQDPQPPMQLGTATFSPNPVTCAPGKSPSYPLSGANCYIATVVGCKAYLTNPSSPDDTLPPVHATVAISTPTSWSSSNGKVVVLFGGGDGEDYFNAGYAGAYFNAGFKVIQVAWGVPTDQYLDQTWRDNLDQPFVKVMKYEGCRPATLLRALYDQINTSGGVAMCAQGHSTGATALAFSLAWYGADNYLDNVVFTSGPPQADIRAGCQYPAVLPFSNPIDVCTQNKCVGFAPIWNDCTQYGNGGHPGDMGHAYDCRQPHQEVDLQDAAKAVAQYTGNSLNYGNCNNTKDTNAATTSNDLAWYRMSVVSDIADYSYPKTSVYAFLCSTTVDLPNNSAAQAWLYLNKILSTRNGLHGFYRVDGCTGIETIWAPDSIAFGDGGHGFDVSKQRMIDDCVKSHP
jgi:hypothetical protein